MVWLHGDIDPVSTPSKYKDMLTDNKDNELVQVLKGNLILVFNLYTIDNKRKLMYTWLKYFRKVLLFFNQNRASTL